MSLAGLVQYDSSDDSNNESDNEDTPEIVKKTNISDKIKIDSNKVEVEAPSTSNQGRKLILPDPVQSSERLGTHESPVENSLSNLFLNTLPKPKVAEINEEIEDEDDFPLPKATKFAIEKPPKKEKGPVRISIPSLSDFDDISKPSSKKIKEQPSKKLCGVLALLPPPRDEIPTTSKNLIPHVLTKTNKNTLLKPTQLKNNPANCSNIKNNINPKPIKTSHALNSLNYDSNSDDEDEELSENKEEKTIDFFSLSKPVNLPLSDEIVAANILPVSNERILPEPKESMEIDEDMEENSGNTLTSTVMNLPKDEILLKNKAEVGPKLPVPEQEFNVDAGGNVAFDDKAIEYLCGKRGVKRKNEIMNDNEIVDINGEDMKPDEREWLVKALTEEPVRRPVSLGSGPSSQSKKKHQITYLAHQAKAMEIELQNQWASSNLARKQTRSKYGF